MTQEKINSIFARVTKVVRSADFIKTISAMVFWAVMMLVAYSVTIDLYFANTNKDYYVVNKAFVVDTPAKICKKMGVVLTYTAETDLQGSRVIKMILASKNQPEREVISMLEVVAIEKGTDTKIIDIQVPCDIQPGEYFWRGSMQYNVRRYSHITKWQTEMFQVVQ